MEPSNNPVPGVYLAIHAITKDIGFEGIGKDRRNAQQGYSFRGIDDIYNTLNPLLAEHGLLILPRMQERNCEERQSSSGGRLFYVTVKAEFDMVAVSDASKHVISTFGEAMDSADKATNKAMSAAYKYACMQAFAIPTQGHDDADASTPDPGQRVGLSMEQRKALERMARDAQTAFHIGATPKVREIAASITVPDQKRYFWALLGGTPAVQAFLRGPAGPVNTQKESQG